MKKVIDKNRCKMYCAWLGYDYNTDSDGHIKGAQSNRCLKYKCNLGNPAMRCQQCKDEEK